MHVVWRMTARNFLLRAGDTGRVWHLTSDQTGTARRGARVRLAFAPAGMASKQENKRINIRILLPPCQIRTDLSVVVFDALRVTIRDERVVCKTTSHPRRSEERRVGKECVSTCRSRGS